jgi:diadenosine tetraphosphate (Ap4A) HIT family hydrolase
MAVTELTDKPCELCNSAGGELLWKDAFCRVVLVADRDYPGFCRVVLAQHVREMTDLPPEERSRLMDAVFAAESALRELAAPDKINLASFGNVVPHLHWHVIPRWRDDRHFPAPVWAAPARDPATRSMPDRARLSRRLGELLG